MIPFLRLPFKRTDASAAEDAALVWDATASAPAISRSGAFRNLSVRVDVPGTATSAGGVGDYAADASWLYVCTAANTWRRVALSTF